MLQLKAVLNGSKSLASTINALPEISARNGIPTVVNDNVATFTLEEFKTFDTQNGIQ